MEEGRKVACHLPFIPPSMLHSSTEGGQAKCCGPKAKKTDRGMRPPPPSPSSHVWLRVLFGLLPSMVGVGGLLVVGVWDIFFFFGLRLFLVSSYKKKTRNVTPAALTTVSFLWPVLVQPIHQGLWSKRIMSLNKAYPCGFFIPSNAWEEDIRPKVLPAVKTWNHPPRTHPQPRLTTTPSVSLLCLNVLACGSSRELAWPSRMLWFFH